MAGRIKRFMTSPAGTLGAFALAAVLLLFSSIGGARAALTYYSNTYSSRVRMDDIGVSLLENGTKISWRDYDSKGDGSWNEATGTLLEHMLPEGETFKIGKTYDEVLSASNSGTINQYVRVSLYKYWLDKDGKKVQDLNPDLIKVDLDNAGDGGVWLVDRDAVTPERTVLYYSKLLESGQETAPFTKSLTVDNAIVTEVSQKTETIDKEGKTYTKVTTTYSYNGAQFCVEAVVDAVQEHNAEDAILSAWGREVSIGPDGTLSLK